MRKIHRAVLLVVYSLAVGCGRPPGHSATPTSTQEATARKDYFDFVTRVQAPLEASLARFDAATRDGKDTALREAAQEALTQARRAREIVENSRVPRPLAYARDEELIFLNHLVLGFQRYLEGGGGTEELERLASILRRGREHQKASRVPTTD